MQNIRDYCNNKLCNINYNLDNIYEVSYETDLNDPYLIIIISQIDKWKEIWGNGIEEPLICIKNIPIKNEDIITMGNNGDSFKINKNGISYVKFKDLDFYNKLTSDNQLKYITVVGKANMNNWGGRQTPQIFIEDYNIEDIYDF